jgi:hypothetical protein
MVVIYMFKLLFGKKEKKNVAENSPAVSSEAVNTEPKAISEKKIVAIATAAIAASRGISDCAFDVISIKKIS